MSNLIEIRRKRLQQLLNEKFGGVQARFVDHTGINQGELSALLRVKSFGEKKARVIEAACSLPSGWLDVMEASQDQANYSVIPQHIDIGGSMGHGVMLRDQPGQITGWKVTREWINKNVPYNTGAGNLRIVTGFGDSMRGMFNSGDPLLVDIGVKTVEFDAVYFFRIGEEGFIKRLQRIPGDGIRAISANKEYESWTITQSMDFEVLGRVLKVWESVDL